MPTLDVAGALAPSQLRSGALFAVIAADLLMHAQAGVGVDAVVDQLSYGDGAPRLLERATGMTAAQLGIPVTAALERLRRYARGHDMSIDETAVRSPGALCGSTCASS
ncbi:MAG TPA: ANTAR domain-containing protein [Euzebyales bacterium]|nr:ANTAR domain-containing protein [Euzebyales bacterium]